MSEQERDLIELETDDGSTVTLEVERYFYYNGDEYVLLREPDKDSKDADRYVMKVNPLPDENGDEMEEFVPVDEELTEQLINVISETFTEED